MTTQTPYERAIYVGGIVQASLEYGGPWHRELADLLTRVQGTAMQAAGLTDDQVEAGADGWPDVHWPEGDDSLEEQVIADIVNRMFEASKAYLEGQPEPVTA